MSSNEQQSLQVFDPLDKYTPRALIVDSDCSQPLTNTTFLKLLEKLEDETIEVSRLEMAEKALGSYCFTANQIVRIMSLFNFEENKLKLAKEAYASGYDRDNYFIVIRELKLEQSKLELKELIENTK